MEEKIILIIAGAVVGGAVSSIGFLLKKQREEREKINESLFHLLEIWFVIRTMYACNSSKVIKSLFKKLKYIFPEGKIEASEVASFKAGFQSVVNIFLGLDTQKLHGELLDKYLTSVRELAKIYPMLAFQLNHNKGLILYLNFIDELFNDDSLNGSSDALVLANMREFMIGEAVEQLETDLMTLSAASGYKNKKRMRRKINRFREKINKELSEIDLDEIMDKIMPFLRQISSEQQQVPSSDMV